MVRSHTIEPKGIINPCNEVDVRAYGFARVFLLLKICIMIVFKIANENETLEVNFCEKGLYIEIESASMENIILTLDEAEELKNFLRRHLEI